MAGKFAKNLIKCPMKKLFGNNIKKIVGRFAKNLIKCPN